MQVTSSPVQYEAFIYQRKEVISYHQSLKWLVYTKTLKCLCQILILEFWGFPEGTHLKNRTHNSFKRKQKGDFTVTLHDFYFVASTTASHNRVAVSTASVSLNSILHELQSV